MFRHIRILREELSGLSPELSSPSQMAQIEVGGLRPLQEMCYSLVCGQHSEKPFRGSNPVASLLCSASGLHGESSCPPLA